MSESWSLPEVVDALRRSTPARILVGRSGTRPRTADLLRFQVDHACARDAVRTPVEREFPDRLGCVVQVHSASRDKREYLLDPESGRRLRPGEADRLRKLLPQEASVLVALGDGLSSQAVESQAPVLLPTLLDCLRADGIDAVGPIFVHGARVGVLDALGEVLAPKVGILLVGERPGLATARSLSAYLGYEPRPGRTDADRNVLSNIHEGGVPALEAAAILAGWIAQMLKEHRSGVGFRPSA